MHDEVLTKEASGLVSLLARFKDFYLVGGTALALQIGHRRSVDFDLFSSQPLPPRLFERVKRLVVPNALILTYRAPDQLHLVINGVKTTFFYFNYPVVDSLVPYRGLTLASLNEIAAMKAFAIGKRLAYKDYVDWYFLLKEKWVSLGVVITLAQKKFGGEFNDRLFLGQLVSLDEISPAPLELFREPVTKERIQDFLKSEV